MFDRKYLVKIYLGGQASPVVEYFVRASRVVVDKHTIMVDGVSMSYNENFYIAVEGVD